MCYAGYLLRFGGADSQCVVWSSLMLWQRGGGTISAALLAEQGFAGDCLQPTLLRRFGFRQRLKPGVRQDEINIITSFA